MENKSSYANIGGGKKKFKKTKSGIKNDLNVSTYSFKSSTI